MTEEQQEAWVRSIAASVPDSEDEPPVRVQRDCSPLRWTAEPPKRRGWWWLKPPFDFPVVAEVSWNKRYSQWQFWINGDARPVDEFPTYRWAGPLPEPEEAQDEEARESDRRSETAP